MKASQILYALSFTLLGVAMATEAAEKIKERRTAAAWERATANTDGDQRRTAEPTDPYANAPTAE